MQSVRNYGAPRSAVEKLRLGRINRQNMAAQSKSTEAAEAVVDLTKELRDPFLVFYDEDVKIPLPDVEALSSLDEYADRFLRGTEPVDTELPLPTVKPSTTQVNKLPFWVRS